MHDPYYAGRYTCEDFELRYQNNFGMFGVLTMQGNNFSVCIGYPETFYEENLVSDRLKFAFGLKAVGCFKIDFNGSKCLVYRAEWETTSEDVEVFPHVLLEDYEKDWLDNKDFRKELCKIIIFRWVMGQKISGYKKIIVVDDKPVSLKEGSITTAKMSRHNKNLLRGMYEDVFHEAIEDMLEVYDISNVRGCLYQARSPLRENVRCSVHYKFLSGVRDIIESITEKMDILEDCDIDEIFDEM